MSPSPLHWLSNKFVVLWSKCGCPITSYFVILFSHSISATDIWSCLVLRLTFFLPIFIFYGGWNGLIGLVPLFSSWACLLLLSTGPPVGPYLFLFSFFFLFFFFFSLGLFSFLFLPLLTNILLYSFFTFYWASPLFGLFKKKKKKIDINKH